MMSVKIAKASNPYHDCDVCQAPILRTERYFRATAFRGGSSAHVECLKKFLQKAGPHPNTLQSQPE